MSSPLLVRLGLARHLLGRYIMMTG
uniref:Uncharacterized protein n=1 Tax=Arundo donax TaxID=35708 RepID=A0A0A9F920_ARUDO